MSNGAKKWSMMDMPEHKYPDLKIIHYCHPDCRPLENIMRLPKDEAFALAKKLADSHPDTTAFYRFSDFENYYRLRKASDALLRSKFISLGGRPDIKHPYSFVLEGSDYLDRWFECGNKTMLSLSSIPDHAVSFTYGDSVATYQNNGRHELVTKMMLFARIAEFENRSDDFLAYIRGKCRYLEVQVWCDLPRPLP